MRKKPMRTTGRLAIAFAVAVTGATLAQVTGAAAAVQADQAKEDKSVRVCRTITPIASRLTRRVCRSQADWDRSRDKAQDGMFDQQMKEFTQPAQAPRP
jgi:hypothetical protein